MPDVGGACRAVDLGAALPAGGRQQHGHVHRAARSARACGCEFERGDPDYPIWVGGYWTRTARCRRSSRKVPPGISGITLQTPNGNGIVISDAPGGGILIKTASGA